MEGPPMRTTDGFFHPFTAACGGEMTGRPLATGGRW